MAAAAARARARARRSVSERPQTTKSGRACPQARLVAGEFTAPATEIGVAANPQMPTIGDPEGRGPVVLPWLQPADPGLAGDAYGLTPIILFCKQAGDAAGLRHGLRVNHQQAGHLEGRNIVIAVAQATNVPAEVATPAAEVPLLANPQHPSGTDPQGGDAVVLRGHHARHAGCIVDADRLATEIGAGVEAYDRHTGLSRSGSGVVDQGCGRQGQYRELK